MISNEFHGALLNSSQVLEESEEPELNINSLKNEFKWEVTGQYNKLKMTSAIAENEKFDQKGYLALASIYIYSICTVERWREIYYEAEMSFKK